MASLATRWYASLLPILPGVIAINARTRESEVATQPQQCGDLATVWILGTHT